MIFMCVNGLVYPITSAACGALWVAGKTIYGHMYAASGPDARMAGSIISHLGDLPLFIMSFKIAYDMLTK